MQQVRIYLNFLRLQNESKTFQTINKYNHGVYKMVKSKTKNALPFFLHCFTEHQETKKYKNSQNAFKG